MGKAHHALIRALASNGFACIPMLAPHSLREQIYYTPCSSAVLRWPQRNHQLSWVTIRMRSRGSSENSRCCVISQRDIGPVNSAGDALPSALAMVADTPHAE